MLLSFRYYISRHVVSHALLPWGDLRYSQFFATRGANVFVNDVNQENAQKVVDAIVEGEVFPPSFVIKGV